MRRWRVAKGGFWALALMTAALPARADQPLLADLTGHLIAITTGFTGTSVVLFGATDGPGDIVAIVRGPERDSVVWQKRHLAGLWINGPNVTFANVPSYYAVFTNRKLDEIAPASAQAQSQIGIVNLRIDPRDPRTRQDETTTFRAALVAEQKRVHLFAEYPGSVAFLGDRLFRATLDFPANVPTGNYLVEVLLIRNGKVVSGQTTPLVIAETGIGADVSEFAENNAALYGLAAVMGAVLLGWLASLPFRDV
ncbi:MAG TPA: TIGR02186 family protein [Stellaceae bacterium]|jgi:uncharacterized protein (TIGR02186 family)|nr:TIGR02186 family protein [Stellaceae bacterium]